MTGQVPPGGWDRPIPPLPPVAVPFAGWWSRVGAALFDLLVISVPSVVLAIVVFGGVGAAFSVGEGLGIFTLVVGILVWLLLMLAVAILYAPLLMARDGARNGQTWGKQLLGIRVVRANGVPFDFGSAALREVVVKGLGLGTAASVAAGIPYLLNALWPLWDDQNRAVHDMIVDTRVVEA